MSNLSEQLIAQRECLEQARTLANTLELCDNANQLYNVLYEMGFHKYEYVANDIYRDGVDKPIAGMSRTFTLWQRAIETKEIRASIDTFTGVVHVSSLTHARTGAVEMLAAHAFKLIQEL